MLGLTARLPAGSVFGRSRRCPEEGPPFSKRRVHPVHQVLLCGWASTIRFRANDVSDGTSSYAFPPALQRDQMQCRCRGATALVLALRLGAHFSLGDAFTVRMLLSMQWLCSPSKVSPRKLSLQTVSSCVVSPRPRSQRQRSPCKNRGRQPGRSLSGSQARGAPRPDRSRRLRTRSRHLRLRSAPRQSGVRGRNHDQNAQPASDPGQAVMFDAGGHNLFPGNRTAGVDRKLTWRIETYFLLIGRNLPQIAND